MLTSCAPALLLQSTALFEFAIAIILNVPAWTKRLQSRKAISKGAGTHQRSGQLSSRHIVDETGPQAGIGSSIPGSRLGKPLPTRQCSRCCHLHFAHLLVTLNRA